MQGQFRRRSSSRRPHHPAVRRPRGNRTPENCCAWRIDGGTMATIRPSTIRPHEPIVHGAASRARRGAQAMTAGRILAVTLLVSFALRGLLSDGAALLYWPDESRYRTSRRVAAFVMRGAGDKAVQNLDDAEHVLFKAIAVAPALIEYLMYCEAGTADEECVDHAIEDSARIPAFFFALFSVANI